MKSKVHPTYKTKYRVANWGVGARKQVFVAALAIVTAEGA